MSPSILNFLAWTCFLSLASCLPYSESIEKGGRLLVTLNSNETYKEFLAYDSSKPSYQHVFPLIEQSFEFGDFVGFIGNFTPQAVERLKRCPLVADIEEDIQIMAFEATLQPDAPRHLARLSQKEKLESHESMSYCYENDTRVKVNAYIIDSGVNGEHYEFQGRVVQGADFTNEGPGDQNGHGTHVAGLVGSSTYGSAKDANIIEVKALNKNGAGTLSGIISAIEFAATHRKEQGVPGVANLSLGSIINTALNKAVDSAYDTGLIIVAAAGNSNTNACFTSPAGANKAITVGAINDENDELAEFTNWGRCIDINAPGVEIESVHFEDEESSAILTGTSMAAPIVTGQIANLLSYGIDQLEVKRVLKTMSLKGRIPRNYRKLSTPNRIVYNGMEGHCGKNE